MKPTVETCNLALSLLGERATISSVDPPEGSVHAQLCAQMYPLAAGVLLESHPWAWATLATTLAPLAEERAGFVGVFALPSDCVRVWRVSETPGGPDVPYERQASALGPVVCTHTGTAVALYTRDAPFPPLPPAFKLALAHMLAAMLAGPLIKGDTGMATAKGLREMATALTAQAAESDAQQKHEPVGGVAPWLIARN